MEALSFHLQTFDGPLDLLLGLISKNKVNIYDIPIAEILTQYMQYMDDARKNNIEIKSEFVTMAAQLILIKSRLLLPKDKNADEDDDPRKELVEMLLEYQKIKQVSGYFSERQEIGRDLFVKPAEMPEADTAPPDYNFRADDLIKAVEALSARYGRNILPSPAAFSGIVGKEKASVSEKIALITELLCTNGKTSLSEILNYAHSRSEIVAIFLALLELLKNKQVFAEANGDSDYTVTMYKKSE